MTKKTEETAHFIEAAVQRHQHARRSAFLQQVIEHLEGDPRELADQPDALDTIEAAAAVLPNIQSTEAVPVLAKATAQQVTSGLGVDAWLRGVVALLSEAAADQVEQLGHLFAGLDEQAGSAAGDVRKMRRVTIKCAPGVRARWEWQEHRSGTRAMHACRRHVAYSTVGLLGSHGLTSEGRLEWTTDVELNHLARLRQLFT